MTFYASTQDLPSFVDYSMKNRTYRYFTGKALFAFGHGLSYTHFEYGTLKGPAASTDATSTLHFEIDVKNSGTRDGDEVVQFYVKHLDSKEPQPLHSLVAFQRIPLAAGQTKTVGIDIPASLLRYWDTTSKSYIVEPGHYEFQAGAASDDIRSSLPVEINAH